jgi:hypothetical protein
MNEFERYLASRGQLQLGDRGERFRDLLRTVNTYNVNRMGGQALGLAGANIDQRALEGKTKPGLLESTFKVLDAPRRVAFRAIGVDPSVTGGDVFRQQKDDSALERIGKFAGAFAFDVATDPLTYVGGVAPLGRKAAASTILAPTTRKAALESAEQALRKAARDPDALVETLYRANPLVKQADEQALRLGTDLVADDTPRGILLRRVDEKVKQGLADTDAVQVVRRELAEEELGRVVGESLIVGGRKSVFDNLTRLVGDEKVAREVFTALPSEVRGGIMLRSALGRDIARLPGTGRGTTLGPVGEGINKARFLGSELVGRATATVTGGSGISGQFGPSWQAVRSGLRKAMADPGFDILKDNLGRTTITTYDALKRAHRNMVRARTTGMWGVWNTLGGIRAIARDFEDAGTIDEFYRGLNFGFHTPEAGLQEQITPALQAGMEEARKLREALDLARTRQVEAGIDISDLGEGYIPLIPTEAEKLRILETRPRGAGTRDVNLSYSPEVSRTRWIVNIADPEEAKSRGFRIKDTDNVALNPAEINRMLGRDAYLTDPLQIAEVYLERAAKNVAGQNFVNEALRAGVLVADTNYSQTQARFERLASFMSGVQKAAPKVAQRVRSAQKQAEEDFIKATSKEVVEETVAQATQRRMATQARYDAAKNVEASVAAELRDATDAVNAARPTSRQVQARLVEYARTGTEQEVAGAAREAGTAARRARRAAGRLEEANEEVDLTRAMVAEFGDEAQPLADEAFEKAETLVEPYILSKEARQEAVDQLAAARAVRTGRLSNLSAEELRQVAEFENALKRQLDLTARYDAAKKARVEASSEWSKVRKAPSVASADTLRELAKTYSVKYQAFLRAKAEGLDKDTIANLRKEAQEAEKLLKRAVGYDTAKDSPINIYRNQLVDMARKLSATEISASEVLSAEGKLTELVGQLQEAYDAGDLPAITRLAESMKETYFNIRDKVTFDDLSDLHKAEQRLLGAAKKSDVELTQEAARASEFGEWLLDSDMRYIAGSVEAGNVQLPRRLAGLHASSGVRVVLENMYRAETTTAFRNFITNITDPLLLMWKTGVTVGRGPGYVLSNLIGGIYMSFIGGVSANSLKQSAAILNSFRTAFNQAKEELPRAAAPQQVERAAEILTKKLAGKKIGNMDAFEALREFLEFGGYGSTQTVEALQLMSRYGTQAPTEAIRFGETVRRRGEELTSPAGKGYQRFVDFMLTNPYQTRMNDLAQNSELFLRFGAFVDTIKKYDDVNLAFDRVNLLHFDYADLSEAEQTIRRLVPFYTWTRNNVPAQLRAMVLEPGKIKKWLYAQQEFKAMLEDDEDSWYEQMLPEYLQDVGGFVSRLAGEGGNIAFGSRLPFDDINRLFKVGGFPVNLREGAKMIGPATTLPYAMIAGVNPDTGAAFGSEGLEATGYQAVLAQLPFLGKTGREGDRRLRETVGYAITEALPQVSFIDRVLSVPETTRPLATKQQQERALSNFLNLTGIAAATGFSTTTLTELSLNAEARKRIEKQNAVINEAAGQLGISVEWLREQIRAGYSDTEIAAMIRSGMGQLEEYERGKEGNRKPLDERYATMIRAMGEGRLDLGY